MRLPWVLLPILFACRPPPLLEDDTPDGDGSPDDGDLDSLSLADVIPTLFRDFDEDTDRLAGLVGVLEAQVDEEGFDLEGDPFQREFTLEHLPHTMLGAVEPPEGTDPEAQVSIVVFGRGTRPFADALDTVLEPNQICIESNSTVYYQRTFTSDVACLREGTCDRLTSTAEVRKELSFLAAGWYDFHKDYRRFTTSDGRDAVVARGWIPEVYVLERGGTAWQTFTVETWVDNGDTVDRMYAIWGELDIGLNEVAMRDLTSDTLHQAMGRQDKWAEEPENVGEWCGQDRGRVNDRP